METDNNKNQDSDIDDPTLELEPLSEAACSAMLQADHVPAEPGAVAGTAELHESDVGSALAPDDAVSEIQGLREELKYRLDMNSILRHGNDQLRETCDRLAEQVSSLLENSEALRNELEQSRQQAKEPKRQLAQARDPGQKDPELTDTGSDSKAKLAPAGQEAGQRRSGGARQTSPRSPGAGPGRDSQVQDCLVLLGRNDVDAETWVLGDGAHTIGSGPDCDIRIQSNFVSRHHARLIRTPDGSILEDLNSTNGTYINSRRINKRVMRAGDLVTIGKTRLRYRERAGHLKVTDSSKFGSGLQSGMT